MKTATFNEIIARVIEKGATKVEIQRSTSSCGCIKQNDIISAIIYKDADDAAKHPYYFCYKVAVQHVFDNPTIHIERLTRETATNRCIDSVDIKDYAYAK